MALVKRGKTWHTHFFVDGQRYRQSLETSDWREARNLARGLPLKRNSYAEFDRWLKSYKSLL